MDWANGERETFKEQLIIALKDQGSKTKSNSTESTTMKKISVSLKFV